MRATSNLKLEMRKTAEDRGRELIMEVLIECDGNKSETARRLGLSRFNLYSAMKKLGIEFDSTGRRKRATSGGCDF
jgi:transcriptional regulator with GAF, ATPase, and Fis domain